VRERGNGRAALIQGGTVGIYYHGDCGRFLTKNDGRSPFTSKGKGRAVIDCGLALQKSEAGRCERWNRQLVMTGHLWP
jgi:hypothetical protein